MAFQRFVRTVRSFAPKVSIWSRGQIGFNTGATHKFHLEKFEYAVLFYDDEMMRIGIHFTNDASEVGVIKITKRPSGVSLSAKAFLQYYDLLPGQNESYDVVYSKDDNMYIIQLKSKSDGNS